jgi:hypothetical protein
VMNGIGVGLGLGLGLGVRGPRWFPAFHSRSRAASRFANGFGAFPKAANWEEFPSVAETRRTRKSRNLLALVPVLALLLSSSPLHAVAEERTKDVQPEAAANVVQNSTHLLIIAGLGGEKPYSDAFFGYGKLLAQAAVDGYGVPAANVTFLAESADRDPVIDGRSGKAEIEAAFTKLATASRPNDAVMIVLIGHGTFNAGESKLSLPGPDLTAQDFAMLVDRLEGRRIAFINTTSASGEFLEAVAQPGRVVLTATKSGMERNQTVFPRYFVTAYAEDVADTDKDGRVSLLEAFVYAQHETVRSYEQDGRLLTEHAVLDDDGDGEGIAEPGEGTDEGALASAFFLGVRRAVADQPPPNATPALQALYAQKQQLEQQIAALRGRKSSMPESEYQKQLEPLLIDLALTSQEIRKLEGKTP